MRQVLLEIPGTHLKVYGYGLMLFFAFLSAMYLAGWRARREKLDPERVYDMAFWMFLGGLVGARAFFVYQYWGTKVKTIFWDAFKIWEGGIVFYGSVLGGAVAFLLYWYFRRFPLRPMLDAIAPSIAVGIAPGRVGCFLNGCCYGDVCNLPWAVRFPHDTLPWVNHVNHHLISPDTPFSLPVHPTQIYSAIDGLVLLLLLSAFYPLRRRDGAVMALLMITYPVTRFLIERLRNDEGAVLEGMTISQALSVGLFLCGALFWVYLEFQPKARYADLADAANLRLQMADQGTRR